MTSPRPTPFASNLSENFEHFAERRRVPGPGRKRDGEKPKQSCKRYAHWLLSWFEFSETELRKGLLARGYEAAETEPTVKYLLGHGFLSDTRYAGIKARVRQGRAGDRKIMLALKFLGVSDSIAREQVATLDPEEERAI